MSVDFKGTAAIVRRALERSFTGLDPGDAVWRGLVGPGLREVVVDVGPFDEDRAAVRMEARAVDAPELDATVARRCCWRTTRSSWGASGSGTGPWCVEQTVLGGHTLHVQEVRISAWAVGWAADAFGDRLAAHAGGPARGREPARAADRGPPRRRRPRGLDARAVERFLRQLYGSFEDDPNWGYHGGFGSTRVFCRVQHYLETSTAVIVGSPVLSGVALTDALALDAYAVAEREPFGRFSLSEERGELWFEHAILGDDLDPDELRTAIDTVARVGDAEDDRLKAAHGGRRYADLVAGT